MKNKLCIASVLAFILLSINPALASGCSSAARQAVAGKPGAQVLSVQSTTNSSGKVVCQVRIKLPSKNGQPGRVVTRNFNPG